MGQRPLYLRMREACAALVAEAGAGPGFEPRKRGAGVSTGPRGAKLGANERGERRASLSFKGFYWRKRV